MFRPAVTLESKWGKGSKIRKGKRASFFQPGLRVWSSFFVDLPASYVHIHDPTL